MIQKYQDTYKYHHHTKHETPATSAKPAEEDFCTDSKVHCEGAHLLCSLSAGAGLNPVKLEHPCWPDGQTVDSQHLD